MRAEGLVTRGFAAFETLEGVMAGSTGTQRPILRRPRLMQPIITRAAPLIVVHGPAGLGKSLLLADIAGVVGHSRTEWITSSDALAAYPERLGRSADTPPRLVLVDDVPGTNDAIAAIRHLGRDREAHLVVASRTPLPAVTAGMVLDGRVQVISTQQLLLTHDDVIALATRLKADISAEDAAELHRATDGWPAIVDATLRSGRSGGSLTERGLKELIDRFVREELLSAIPAEDLAMLTDAAAIPRFDAPALAVLLADHDAAADPVLVIDSWAASGWIIYDSIDSHWRIPQPIRQSLLTDLDIRHPGRRAELTTKAVQALVAAGRTTDALPYLVEASLTDVVAGVLRDKWGDDVVPQGHILTTRSAVASMPDEILAGDPTLLLISAVSALRGPVDTDTLALRLAQADAVIDRESFNGPLVTFHSLSMMLARIRGDIDEANTIERAGQAFIDAATDDERHEHVNRIVYFNHQVGTSRLAEGRLQEADAAFRSARSMARNNRGDWYVAVTDSKLAYISFLRGQLQAARQEIESTRAYAEPRSDELLIEHVNMISGLLELEHGRAWSVRSMLSRAQGMIRRDAEPPASRLALAWSMLGLLSSDAGAAEQALLLCGSDYATNQLPLNRFLAAIARAQARLAQGDPKAALNELDDAVAPPGHAAMEAIVRAHACLAMDEAPAAIRELAAYTDTNDPLPLTVRADLLALLTECALRRGHDARPAFSRLLAVLERTGARRPVLLLPQLCEAVVTGRLSAPSSSPLASLAVEVAALTRANRDGAPQLSERETEVLSALADATTLADIATSMYVSSNTLKTIARGLYRKLGAADRHEAVSVARALGLAHSS